VYIDGKVRFPCVACNSRSHSSCLLKGTVKATDFVHPDLIGTTAIGSDQAEIVLVNYRLLVMTIAIKS
jgi:hypothetical protein